ncbi:MULTISPECIES: hypothetical protein [unclassified Caballeronia]|nr:MULTISPECIES: hypothetical protein [unclassified Caballeronia]MDR5736457.1 hypothetical protein [Caballeronia sp. LZ016]MDR5811066.1 hypothetical protein [Caballeronia sp. LZ019]
MLDFVMGFFRDYWPLVLMCAFGQFGMPRLLDWQFRRRELRRQREAAKH